MFSADNERGITVPDDRDLARTQDRDTLMPSDNARP
jgi:hypothetical protein